MSRLTHSLFAALVLYVAARADAQPSRPAIEADRILELPKLIINEAEELPPLEAWRYTKVGDLEILSNVSDGATRSIIADFIKFQQSISCVWPRKLSAYSSIYLVLVNGTTPINQELLYDTSLVRSLKTPEQLSIILNPANRFIELNGIADSAHSTDSFGNVSYEADYSQLLYREYISLLFQENSSKPPPWFEEGILQIVMAAERTDKWLVFGKIDSYRGAPQTRYGTSRDAQDSSGLNSETIVGEASFNKFFATRDFIPFGEFFSEPRNSALTSNPLANNRWAKQSYAFVHFCMFGGKLQYLEKLGLFISRLAAEPLSENLFRECFGMGYAEMEKLLRSYIYYTRHRYQRYDLTVLPKIKKADIILVDASTALVSIITGDTLRIAGKRDAAYAAYRNAYRRGQREPALLAGLAFTTSDMAIASAFTNRAIEEGVQRPSLFVHQARLRLAAYKADAGPGKKLTPQQLDSVLTPLFKARQLSPPLADVYVTIAEAWSASEVAPKPDHLALLQEGINRFPRESALAHRSALLYQGIGLTDTAAGIARRGLRFAMDDASRADLEAFLATLEQSK